MAFCSGTHHTSGPAPRQNVRSPPSAHRPRASDDGLVPHVACWKRVSTMSTGWLTTTDTPPATAPAIVSMHVSRKASGMIARAPAEGGSCKILDPPGLPEWRLAETARA